MLRSLGKHYLQMSAGLIVVNVHIATTGVTTSNHGGDTHYTRPPDYVLYTFLAQVWF
jgi:hypothetical protein